MTGLVERVFRDYFEKSPDTRRTLTLESSAPLTERYATKHFRDTVDGTQWENVRGFHVFRHSFASNAAIEGVDQRMIDEWMGHQTDEMRRRYRHLAPSHQQAAIDSVFDDHDRQAG